MTFELRMWGLVWIVLGPVIFFMASISTVEAPDLCVATRRILATSAPAVSATPPATLPPFYGVVAGVAEAEKGPCQWQAMAGEWQMAFSRARTPGAKKHHDPPAGAGRRLRLFVSRRDRIP